MRDRVTHQIREHLLDPIWIQLPSEIACRFEAERAGWVRLSHLRDDLFAQPVQVDFSRRDRDAIAQSEVDPIFRATR